MEWTAIETAGKSKYKLTDEWHLCGADASDPEVMQVEFSKKGPRGAWLRGERNRFKGFIVYKREGNV